MTGVWYGGWMVYDYKKALVLILLRIKHITLDPKKVNLKRIGLKK
mgnify:CR=1 FL=1